MNKTVRILLLVLACAMLICTFAIGVFAEDNANEAKVIDKDGNETEYATFAEAVSAAASKGYTIVLLKDVTVSGNTNLNRATLDLNGKTFNRINGNDKANTFASGTSGANYTITGEGVINTGCRVFELHSGAGKDADGNAGKVSNSITVKGTGKGIVVNTTGSSKLIGIGSGYITFENVTFNIASNASADDKVSDRTTHFNVGNSPFAEYDLVMKDCVINDTKGASNLFATSGSGAAMKLENVIVNSKSSAAFAIKFEETDAEEYEYLTATNCYFNLNNTNETSFIHNGNKTVSMKRVANFTDCYIRAYRVFQLGGDAGVYADGAKFTFNLNGCDVITSVHSNNPGILRGVGTYINATDCRFGASANFESYPGEDTVKLVNCRFSKAYSTAVSICDQETYGWYYTAEDPEFPWVYLPKASAENVADFNTYHDMQGKTWTKFTESTFTETDNGDGTFTYTRVSHKVEGNNTSYHGIGHFHPRFGRVDMLYEAGNNGYLKYTITDPYAGTQKASTTGTVKYKDFASSNSDPYFTISTTSDKTLTFAGDNKLYGLFVIDFDIRTDSDEGLPTMSISIQTRDDSGNKTKTSMSINSTTKLHDGTSLSDKQWHHIQCVFDVEKNTTSYYIDGELITKGTATSAASAYYVRGVNVSISNSVNQKIGASLCFDNIQFLAYKFGNYEKDSDGNAIVPAAVSNSSYSEIRNNTDRGADSVVIGGHYFASLEAAYNYYALGTTASKTIKLLSDVTAYGMVFAKDLTLDLAGHTYTAVTDDFTAAGAVEVLGLQVLEGSKVTIKNGTVTTTDKLVGAAPAGVLIRSFGDLSLENVTLTAPADATVLSVGNSGSVTVNTEGNVTGGIDVAKDALLTVYSGIYTVAIDPAWCAEGLVPVAYANGTYGVAEFDGSAYFTYLGTGLKWSGAAADNAKMRYGYKLADAGIKGWGWNYGINVNAMNYAQGVNIEAETGITNLVVTDIATEYYDDVIYVQLVLYVEVDGNVYTVTDVAREQTVINIAKIVAADENESAKSRAYAESVIAAYEN